MTVLYSNPSQPHPLTKKERTKQRKSLSLISWTATLPIICSSFLGFTSLSASAAPSPTEDITAKLEFCKTFNNPIQRQRCFKRVREYCKNNYPVAFCKQTFKDFFQGQDNESSDPNTEPKELAQ